MRATQTDKRTDRLTDRRTDGRTDVNKGHSVRACHAQIDRRTDRLTDGRTDGRTSARAHALLRPSTCSGRPPPAVTRFELWVAGKGLKLALTPKKGARIGTLPFSRLSQTRADRGLLVHQREWGDRAH
jgi:hypothetical protein